MVVKQLLAALTVSSGCVYSIVIRNAMRTFERMGVIGPAPNDPSPIGIDANELDPTKMPYSPDMIQLMPSKIRRTVLLLML